MEESNPFNLDCDKQFLVSFSTGLTSTTNDVVDAERAAEAGREMQIHHEGVSNIYHTGKVQGTGPFITQKDSQGQ